MDSNGYTFIGSVTFEKKECKLENNIVIFNLELILYSNQTNCFSVTAFNDGQESIFSEAYCIPPDSNGVSTDNDGVSYDSDGDGIPDDTEINIGTDPQDPDSDDDGIWDGLELELGKDPLCPDATVEYSVQVTLDPELHSISIPDPRGYDVFYDTVSRWDWDFDKYKFSQEVGIANCRLDGEFVTCDLKIEFEPGGTYFLSLKAFDNLYESAFSNEMSFTLPEDADFDGIPDKGESVYGTDPHDPDSDNDGILDGRELELGTDPLH
ncbi:MAG: hypothetical protein KAI90_07500, partial [Desulfobulbaceae bacterium]|nr:hypothetical protein [Desulfobulbaceae bacterium]